MKIINIGAAPCFKGHIYTNPNQIQSALKKLDPVPAEILRREIGILKNRIRIETPEDAVFALDVAVQRNKNRGNQYLDTKTGTGIDVKVTDIMGRTYTSSYLLKSEKSRKDLDMVNNSPEYQISEFFNGVVNQVTKGRLKRQALEDLDQEITKREYGTGSSVYREFWNDTHDRSAKNIYKRIQPGRKIDIDKADMACSIESLFRDYSIKKKGEDIQNSKEEKITAMINGINSIIQKFEEETSDNARAKLRVTNYDEAGAKDYGDRLIISASIYNSDTDIPEPKNVFYYCSKKPVKEMSIEEISEILNKAETCILDAAKS